jgi:hypothetical protein
VDRMVTRATTLPDEMLSILHTRIVGEMAERGLPRYDAVELSNTP